MAPNGHCNIEGIASVEEAISSCKQAFPHNYPTVIQKYTSCRWRLCYILVLGLGLGQCLLNSMSFAVVCMTKPTIPKPVINDTISSFAAINGGLGNTTNDTKPLEAEFDYSSETQGLLISSVFYAGILSPLLGSFASRKIGPKRVILISMLTGSTVMLLIPVAARTNVYLALLCRIVIGLSVNTVVPVCFDLWYTWAPHAELAQLVAYCFSGVNVANIITFSSSGLLCLIPVDNGWPYIFYVFGSCSVVWCILWQFCVHETPESHPNISNEEKAYITAKRSNVADNIKDSKIPWKSIMHTKGVWAFFIMETCHAWNASVMFSYLPSYMASVLKFDVEQNGLLSSLPYITRVLGAILLGYITVHMLKVFSVTNTRKLLQTVGFLVAAVLAIVLCYLEEKQKYLAVAIFTISTPFQVATVNSGFVTPFDMAPQYASMIVSCGSVFSYTAMMTCPIAVSYIITERTREQWSYVFYMTAGVFVFGALIFLVFGNGELQEWAKVTKVKSDTENKNGHVNISYVAAFDEVTHM